MRNTQNGQTEQRQPETTADQKKKIFKVISIENVPMGHIKCKHHLKIYTHTERTRESGGGHTVATVYRRIVQRACDIPPRL